MHFTLLFCIKFYLLLPLYPLSFTFVSTNPWWFKLSADNIYHNWFLGTRFCHYFRYCLYVLSILPILIYKRSSRYDTNATLPQSDHKDGSDLRILNMESLARPQPNTMFSLDSHTFRFLRQEETKRASKQHSRWKWHGYTNELKLLVRIVFRHIRENYNHIKV